MATLILLASGTTTAAAEITFRSGISDGMVIQRGQPITLGGSAAASSGVVVRLASETRSVEADVHGHWSVTFPAMDGGGPHTLTASGGGKEVTLDDVWVGDVWLASGQSNMQMGLAETVGGEEALADLSRLPAMRFLEIPRGGADAPASDFKASWRRGTPESLAKFSAVACYFARQLRQHPALAEVPLGLINSTFGGTSIEAWSPADSLTDLPKDQLSGSMFGIPPGSLYNGMIHPLHSMPVKGVLWYQGEANAGQPALYVRLLRNLMTQWRTGWKQPDLPFLIVQLPAFEGKMGGLDFGWLREAQDSACQGFPNAWNAVSHDTTDGFDLHPGEKQEIGRRLALIAEREVYALAIPAHGPRIKEVQATGSAMLVTFDQSVHPAEEGRMIRGFALAGDDGEYRYARASVEGPTVRLEAGGVPQPKTVRYAWGGLPDANLTGPQGLPAFPFRTDTWLPESVAFQPLPAFQRIETPDYQLQTGTHGQIASLIVRGHQFLSNEAAGGTGVPGGFGFRNLAHTTVLGPRRLALSDGGVTLEVACGKTDMTWTLSNHGTDPVDLHINFTREVEVRSQGPDVTLQRDTARIELNGINRVEGHKVIATAAPQSSRTLRFSISPP